MLTLFGNLDSGNVHKIQMILKCRQLPFRRVDVRQDLDQPHDPRFLRLCPMGKIPAVMLDDGEVLTESGALLYYFAHDTPFWPTGLREQSEVLRWMFFEQYSHEPALAVLRYLKRFAASGTSSPARLRELETKAAFVLDVLDQRLTTADWIATSRPTIADIALYPYSRLADEIGLPVETSWPSVAAWLQRIESLDGFLPVYADAASEVIAFEQYFLP